MPDLIQPITFPEHLKDFLFDNFYDKKRQFQYLDKCDKLLDKIEDVTEQQHEDLAQLSTHMAKNLPKLLELEQKGIVVQAEYFSLLLPFTKEEEKQVTGEQKADMFANIHKFLMGVAALHPRELLLKNDLYLKLFKQVTGTDFAFWFQERMARAALLMREYLQDQGLDFESPKDIPETEDELGDLIHDLLIGHFGKFVNLKIFEQNNRPSPLEAYQNLMHERLNGRLDKRQYKQAVTTMIFQYKQLSDIAAGLNLEDLRNDLVIRAIFTQLNYKGLKVTLKLHSILHEIFMSYPRLTSQLNKSDYYQLVALLEDPLPSVVPFDALFNLSVKYMELVQSRMYKCQRTDSTDEIEKEFDEDDDEFDINEDFDNDEDFEDEDVAEIPLNDARRLKKLLSAFYKLLKLRFQEQRMDPSFRRFVFQYKDYKVKSTEVITLTMADAKPLLEKFGAFTQQMKKGRNAALKHIDEVFEY